MEKQRKEFKIGTLDRYGVFIEVELRHQEKGIELSICGHTQYRSNCDWNMAGQINDTLRSAIFRIKFKNGWNRKKLITLLNIWDRWHLNDMHAGCEHQRAEKWNEIPIDPSYPTNKYVKFGGNTLSSWNMAVWLPESQGGLLGKACSVCGYRYGTAWLFEELPQYVLDWFESLPSEE